MDFVGIFRQLDIGFSGRLRRVIIAGMGDNQNPGLPAAYPGRELQVMFNLFIQAAGLRRIE